MACWYTIIKSQKKAFKHTLLAAARHSFSSSAGTRTEQLPNSPGVFFSSHPPRNCVKLACEICEVRSDGTITTYSHRRYGASAYYYGTRPPKRRIPSEIFVSNSAARKLDYHQAEHNSSTYTAADVERWGSQQQQQWGQVDVKYGPCLKKKRLFIPYLSCRDSFRTPALTIWTAADKFSLLALKDPLHVLFSRRII